MGECACAEKNVLIFACSGGSDCGELSDRIARKLARDGKGRMYCLSGIGGHVPAITETAKAAGSIVAVDGCPALCAKKTLEHAGLSPRSFNLAELGFQKGKTEVSEKSVGDAIDRMFR
jgi:uncharacterized metal-binding protein